MRFFDVRPPHLGKKILPAMDADLQHEPEAVPAVAAPVIDKEIELTVGCRYMDKGGIAFDWSIKRQILSTKLLLVYEYV